MKHIEILFFTTGLLRAFNIFTNNHRKSSKLRQYLQKFVNLLDHTLPTLTLRKVFLCEVSLKFIFPENMFICNICTQISKNRAHEK